MGIYLKSGKIRHPRKEGDKKSIRLRKYEVRLLKVMDQNVEVVKGDVIGGKIPEVIREHKGYPQGW